MKARKYVTQENNSSVRRANATQNKANPRIHSLLPSGTHHPQGRCSASPGQQGPITAAPVPTTGGPGSGGFEAIQRLAGAGCSPPCPSLQGSVSQWVQGRSLPANTGVVAVPGCCCYRLCSKQELLAPAQGCWEAHGASSPACSSSPKASADDGARAAAGARRGGGGLWAPHCPQQQECCQSEGQPRRTALAYPSLRGGTPEPGSAPPCCGGTLGSLSCSGPITQWEPHHSPPTVQPQAGAQAGVCSC